MAEYMRDVPHQKIKGGEKHICPECFHCPVCIGRANRPCIECDKYIPAANVRENVIRTQADKLRAMSDEELAELLGYGDYPPWCVVHKECPHIEIDPPACERCALDWLKSPVEGTE